MTEGRTVRDTDGFISFYMYVYAVFRTHGATRRFGSEHKRLPLQTGAPAFMGVRASMHSTSAPVRIPLIFFGRRQTHRGHIFPRRSGML